METYNTITEATQAAEKHFNSKVGIESANGTTIEFYSKNEPGDVDTFTVEIKDGKLRSCKNGGEITIIGEAIN